MPTAKFPLFHHATGQWAKKIRGRTVYFGTDKTDALKRYRSQAAELHAGRRPRTANGELTIRELCNQFLTMKLRRVEAGELAKVTWYSYWCTCDRLTGELGKHRLVEDLAAGDFERLRAEIASTCGPAGLRTAMIRTRTVFKFAFDSGLIDRPLRLGMSFQVPSARAIRKARQNAGDRMIEPADLQRLIAEGRQPIRAMILLGLNCAFGQTDIANLPAVAVDLDGGWVRFPRVKTAIDRRCPLWPETVDAVREAIAIRPEAKAHGDEELVFLTVKGARWVRMIARKSDGIEQPMDALAPRFRGTLKAAGLTPRGFYVLRHIFRTVADECRDEPAVDLIMGHLQKGIAASYRERIEDRRLHAVVQYVRDWVFKKT